MTSPITCRPGDLWPLVTPDPVLSEWGVCRGVVTRVHAVYMYDLHVDHRTFWRPTRRAHVAVRPRGRAPVFPACPRPCPRPPPAPPPASPSPMHINRDTPGGRTRRPVIYTSTPTPWVFCSASYLHNTTTTGDTVRPCGQCILKRHLIVWSQRPHNLPLDKTQTDRHGFYLNMVLFFYTALCYYLLYIYGIF